MKFKRLILTFILIFTLLVVATGGSATLLWKKLFLSLVQNKLSTTTVTPTTTATTATITTNGNVLMKNQTLLSGGGGSSSSSSSSIPSPSDPNYIHWCLEMEGTSIYTLGSKLNCPDNAEAFSMGLMVAVFFTVCIEVVMHSLEHHITNYVTVEILNKVYQELMVRFMTMCFLISCV